MKPNKIIICAPELGISPDSNSGGELHDREVLRNLAKLGVKVEIILPKGRKYDKGIENWQVTQLPIKTVFPPYLLNLILIPYLFKIFKRTNYDAIRVFSPYFCGFAALVFKLFHPKIPLVAIYHHLENSNVIFTLIDRLIIKKFDHIITVSNATKKELIKKYSLNETKITVAYIGVDKQLQPKTKNQTLLNQYHLEGKKVLLFLGGLKFRKNVSFLLDLLKELKDSSVVLIIAGEGNARNLLKLKTWLLGIQNQVRFTGYIPEKRKSDFFNLCDVFLVPSKKEGFGAMSIEAQACGKPVLVSDSSSLPETLIDGQTGFVCRLNDKKDWLEKLTILLKDDKLCESMGRNAIKFASKFSWKKFAKVQKEVFGRLVKLNA